METATTNKTRSKTGLIFLAFIAFISLGLPDGLLGVAWPSIRTEYALPLDALGLLLFATTTGYLTSSFFSGKLMARLGVGGLLAASCFATGTALLGYTLVPSWGFIVALGMLAGLGAGAIDAGINTYIASEHGEGLMQWLHASFGVGITLGPIIMTTGINLFEAWRPGYWLVGTAQIALAVCFALTAAMWKRPTSVEQAAEAAVAGTAVAETADSDVEERRLIDYRTPLLETLTRPGAWLSMLLFFIYTGVELCLGVWVYTLLTESRHVAPEVAGLLAGSYWGMFTIGRILAGLYTRRAPIDTLLRAAILVALLGVGLLWWSPLPWVGLLGVGVTGFAIAPIFPGLVSGTRGRVGARHAANTIGMQISAAGLGGAAIPGLAGVLAQRTTLEIIPVYLFGLVAALFVLYTLSLLHKANGSAS